MNGAADNAGTTGTMVERMLDGWHWMIRFAAVSVFWAATAWPIVTIPLSAFAANRAWQSAEDLVPWRAYWDGFVHGGGEKSYWVGVPWMMGLIVSGFEITLSQHSHLAGSILFAATALFLDAVMTIWTLYTWSAMAMGFGVVDALQLGLLGLLRRPLGSMGWAFGMTAVVGLGMFLPVAIPLAWGGAISVIGWYGTKEFSSSNTLDRRPKH